MATKKQLKIRHIVTAEKMGRVAVEKLDNRDQRDRWIKKLEENGWRVVSKRAVKA